MKLGSENLSLLEDSQLLGDEASVLANLKLPDARIKPAFFSFCCKIVSEVAKNRSKVGVSWD